MPGSSIVNALMIVFTLGIAGILLLAAVRWRGGIVGMLERRSAVEIAERRADMAALAAALDRPGIDTAQAERLARNFRYHRAVLIALDPRGDLGCLDAAFASATTTAPVEHRAAA